jgi:chondroitin AC lyase
MGKTLTRIFYAISNLKAVLLFVVLCSNSIVCEAQSQADINLLRTRFYDLYFNADHTPPPNTNVNALGRFGSVDYKHGYAAAAKHLDYLMFLAKAYVDDKTPVNRARYYHQDSISLKIHLGLNYWVNNCLKPGQLFYSANNWDNQIGEPNKLVQVMFWLTSVTRQQNKAAIPELSNDELNAAVDVLKVCLGTNGFPQYGSVNKYATGQNLVWESKILLQAAILKNKADSVEIAAKWFKQAMEIKNAEGILADWSFWQHGPQLYSGGYGAGFAEACSSVAVILNGTWVSLHKQELATLSNFILEGEQWMMRGPSWDYNATGREISRDGSTTSALVNACNNMVKVDPLKKAAYLNLANRINGSGTEGSPVGNHQYWRTDFMVHQRTAFYASVKMNSKRTFGSESGNEEGIKDYHLGQGTMAIMQRGDEYGAGKTAIAPLWDWQKLPGTTARIRPPSEALPLITWGHNAEGRTDFVGGVSDGVYGVSAYDQDKDSVSAHKAYFFFDKEFVCLGANVQNVLPDKVMTTLNQCFKSTGQQPISYLQAGESRPTQLISESVALTNPKWVYHDSIAYVFNTDAKIDHNVVELKAENRTFDWSTINANAYSNTPIPGKKVDVGWGDVFSLSIDHGSNAAWNTHYYNYTVIPGISKADLEAYLVSPNVKVLTNTADLQAVYCLATGIIQVVFWKGGTLQVPNTTDVIKVDQPCILIFQKQGDIVKFSINDPTLKLTTINISYTNKLTGKNCLYNVNTNNTIVSLHLPKYDLPGEPLWQMPNTATCDAVISASNAKQ